MNDSLFEELLNEDESTTLDFKRDQYPFEGADDDAKAELLKDILAFANAWRRTDAYIIIGVEEVKGGRSVPVGISQHLADHSLQQFVNGKTNRAVVFEYRTFQFNALQIGIIRIPPQERPVYSNKTYGGVVKEAVYLRRGSSTTIANPTEIARMGAADVAPEQNVPTFAFEWADTSAQKQLGNHFQTSSSFLAPTLDPDSLRPVRSPMAIDIGMSYRSGTFYSDWVKYIAAAHLLRPVGFVIKNTGTVAADNLVAKCKIANVEGLHIYDFEGAPERPSDFPMPHLPFNRGSSDPVIHDYDKHRELMIKFGRLSPKATAWTTDVLWIGSERDASISFPLELYADNLPNPVGVELRLSVKTTARPMTRADAAHLFK
jgi:hypothetical protein